MWQFYKTIFHEKVVWFGWLIWFGGFRWLKWFRALVSYGGFVGFTGLGDSSLRQKIIILFVMSRGRTFILENTNSR